MAEFVSVMDTHRREALERVFTGLPNDFLAAMVEGLEDADVITSGRLFSGENGGCVVGVTLRVIDPDFRGPGRLRIWSKHRSIKKAYSELGDLFPKLRALEQVFDKSVLTARAQFPEYSPEEAGLYTAHWVARLARTELIIREMRSEWLTQVVLDRQSVDDALEDTVKRAVTV